MTTPAPEPAVGTLERIAALLVGALQPLEDAFADETAFRVLLLQIGWEANGLPPAYLVVADAATQAVAALDALADDPEVEDIVAVLNSAGAVYRAVEGLTTAPEGIDPAAFLPELGRRLLEYLLARELLAQAPGWYAAAEALGILVVEDHPATPQRPGFVRLRFDWDQIPAILGNPSLIPERVYGWGTPDLNFAKIAELLTELIAGLGYPASLDQLSDETAAALQAGATSPPQKQATVAMTLVAGDVAVPGGSVEPVGLQLAELPAEGTALPGMVLLPKVPDGIDARVDLGRGWALVVRSGTDLAVQLGIAVRPGETLVRYPGAPGQPLPSAGFGVSLAHTGDAPQLVFGQPGRTRLELTSAQVHGAADLKAGDLEVSAGLAVDGLAVVIEPGDADGFLANALGGKPLRVELAFGVAWSSRTGLDFTAGAGLEATVHPHVDTGVVRIDEVALAVSLDAGTPSALQVKAATTLSGAIGPVAYAVDRLGVGLAVKFADGNAGPFDIRLDTLLPTAMGLVVDAGPVTGGGFIGFDPAKGRYVGVIQLEVFDIGISAIAVLDTRAADGSSLPFPGFSFIVIVAVDLPPIQLGFGFVLTGVGGLAGLHRRLDTRALLDGVRSGAAAALLFPSDPVRDAPRIAASLGTIFPVAAGRYVFGPTARIGWGTPPLLTIELAIVLEVPAPITLAFIGTAAVRVPAEIPVVVLNIDVVGVLDMGRSLLAVDASLRDSKVAGFALTGDLAMRFAFGADPDFALAVGGLNPHFDPPPGFPTLRRVSLALGAGDNPRISIEGYFAITSNSLQFGAKAELYAEAGGFSVKGWLGFDALFIRVPFSFRIDFDAGMGLYRGSSRYAGISVTGSLTGPNPFHVWGKASLSLLFFDISVPFDRTFGSRSADPALPPADPWAPLAAAITEAANWSAETLPGLPVGVTVQAPEGVPGLLLLHPMGVAVLRQHVVPLNRILERFGAYSISGPDRFDVTNVLVGDAGAGSWAPVTDSFAPGDFEDLSDSDRLSRGSFEDMVAGVRVGAATVDGPMAELKAAPLDYETRIVDTAWRSRPHAPFPLDRTFQLAASRAGTTALHPAPGRAKFARVDPRPSGVVLGPERFTVATTGTLSALPGVAAGVGRGEAALAIKHTPGVRRAQVVPDAELAGA